MADNIKSGKIDICAKGVVTIGTVQQGVIIVRIVKQVFEEERDLIAS